MLNDEGPCFLIGHSMGGAAAAEAALRRPDLVRALVLEDPAWVDRTDEQTALNGEARVAHKQARMATPEAMGRAIAEKLGYGWAAAHYLTQEEFLATGRVSQSRPWKQVHDELVEAPFPTLVATGTQAGVIVDKRALDLPYHEFSGAGHCIRRDRPDEYDTVVRTFFAAKY